VRGRRPRVDLMTSERIQFARQLREQPTRAEDILWARLRGSRFHGAKFKRQVPFDRYVADFYCHAAKLVVEIDGRQHEWVAGYDEGRTEVLERMGLRVIRFQNDEVCGDLESVLERILQVLRLPSA
jgi:very-short-patch-repair endonuclease